MSSAINEIDMEFKEIKNVNIETIGSLSQITRPCPDVNFVLSSSDTVTPFSYVYLVVLCIVSSVDKLYGGLHWKSNYWMELV
jgi:hypothetical protein